MPRLQIDYAEIQARVDRFMGWRGVANWTAQNTADFGYILKEGLRNFYYPRALGNAFSHEWSFLRPNYRFTTVADQRQYELPPNFDHIYGAINFDDSGSSNNYPPVHITNYQVLQRHNARETYTSFPQLAAIIVIQGDGLTPQRQIMELHPTPDSTYPLYYQYVAMADSIDATNKYPLGGDVHSDTIMSSILAAAESQMDDDTEGAHQRAFLAKLTSSISMDRRRAASQFGYNSNEKRFMPASRSDARDALITGNPTYNGTEYSGD